MTVSLRWQLEPPILTEWEDNSPIQTQWVLTPPILAAWPETIDPATYLPDDDEVPYPAPDGFHWEYVFDHGRQVFSGSDPVFALVENP